MICGEIVMASYSLEKLRDPSARDALTLTLKRWSQPHMDEKQIVEICSRALAALDLEKT